jgi:hypothetical protein
MARIIIFLCPPTFPRDPHWKNIQERSRLAIVLMQHLMQRRIEQTGNRIPFYLRCAFQRSKLYS